MFILKSEMPRAFILPLFCELLVSLCDLHQSSQYTTLSQIRTGGH